MKAFAAPEHFHVRVASEPVMFAQLEVDGWPSRGPWEPKALRNRAFRPRIAMSEPESTVRGPFNETVAKM
jgi:hypothetical protein